jgi:hypothetical protein
LNAGKSGTELDSLLGDAAVAISVSLQHGVLPSALAKSVGRVPETIDGPAQLPASAIGAALHLLCQYELRAAAKRTS